MVPSGNIAMKIFILQKNGIMPVLKTIIIAVHVMQKMNVNLNFFNSLGISSKKLVFSISFAVAPQLRSISNIWHNIACETCNEIPPRKMVSRGIHLKFSLKAWKRVLSSVR